jgi:uncharacterized protein
MEMSEGIVRRQDKAMSETEARVFLAAAKLAHFATVGANGEPYVVPNLFVYAEASIFLHSARGGHFQRNVENSPRICVEAAEAGVIYPYGEFECDTTTSYASVIAFGKIAMVSDAAAKTLFFDRFLEKYADPRWDRPRGFYPRLDQVTVYAITIEHLTGKKGPLPGAEEQWPTRNRTKSPGAVAPRSPRRSG